MPRVMPLYYHYSYKPFICDAFDNTHVQYINDTLDIIRSVFKPQFIHYTKYTKYAFLLLFSIYEGNMFAQIIFRVMNGHLPVNRSSDRQIVRQTFCLH